VPVVLYFVKPAIAGRRFGGRGDDLQAHMARDLDRGSRLGNSKLAMKTPGK
jgi:hypothetical protein